VALITELQGKTAGIKVVPALAALVNEAAVGEKGLIFGVQFRGFLVAAGNDNVGPGRGESQGDGLANAPAPAGDNGDFPF
jgi:hypothetical protein